MKLSEFFSGINQKKQMQEAISKIDKLEQHIRDLEHKLIVLDQRNHHEDDPPTPPQTEQISPPIVVEKLHIEKISIEKFQLSNNFGALGIKELQGKLNIGANYGEGFPFNKPGRPKTKPSDPTDSESTEHSTLPIENIQHTPDWSTATANGPPKYSIKGRGE